MTFARDMRFDCILINLTEECHVGCRHCGYIGSKRDREMTADELDSWVEQVVSYGVAKVIFTGGEAFERFDLLVRGIRRAQSCNALTAVFTSSFWATSLENAEAKLRDLSGISQLYLSTDLYHQERVPVENVHNAIQAALKLGVSRVSLIITHSTEDERASIAAQYLHYEGVEIMSQRLIPNRVSRRTMKGHCAEFGLIPEHHPVQCWLGTPLINPDGGVFACHIGKAAAHRDIRHLPYFLGDLRQAPFAEIMEQARHRADYQYLRTHGPRGVAEMARSCAAVTAGLPRHEFTSPCDMCMNVMLVPDTAEALADYANGLKEEIDLRLNLLLGEAAVFGES